MYQRVADLDQAQEQKWGKIGVGVRLPVLDQKLDSCFCVMDSKVLELLVQFSIHMIQVKHGLQELDERCVILDASKIPR